MGSQLSVVWSADTSKLAAGSKQAEAEIKAVDDSTSRASGGANSWAQSLKAAEGGLSSTGGAAQELGGRAAGLSGILKNVASGFGQFGIGGGVLTSTVGQIGSAIDQSLPKLGASADQVRQFALVTGSSAQEAGKWVNAAQQMNVPLSSLQGSFTTLGKNISEHADRLEADGVAVARNEAGQASLGGTMRNLMGVLQGTADPLERNRIASSALGSSWQQMTPILSSSTSELEQTAGGAEGLTGAMSAATVGLAAGAAAAVGLLQVVRSGVSDFLSAANAVRSFSEATNLSTQDASRWVAGAQILGVSSDSLQSGFARMSANIGAHAEKLQQDGLQIARNADGSVDLSTTMMNLANAFSASSDAAQRDLLAKDALGKGYQALLPILGLTSDQLKAVMAAVPPSLIFDDRQITQAREFGAQSALLKENMKGLSVEVGEEVVPTLNNMTSGLTEVVSWVSKFTSEVSSATGGTSGWVGEVKSALGAALTGPLAALGAAHNKATQAVRDAIAAAQQNAQAQQAEADNVTKAQTALQTLVGAEKSYASSLQQVTSAQRQVTSATQQIASAQLNLEKVQADVGAIMNRSGQYALDLASAQEQVRRSTMEITSAQLNLEQVQQSVGDIMNRSGQYGLDLASAQTSVANAARQLTDATTAYEQAQQDTNNVMQDAGTYASDLAHAQLSVAQAQLGQRDALIAVERAQQQVGQALGTGDPIAVAEAQDALAASQLNVQNQALTLTDAQTKLTDTQNEAIPGTLQYQQIQNSLADAAGRVTDAQNSETDAQFKLSQVVAESTPGTLQYAQEQNQLADAQMRVSEAVTAQTDAQYKLSQLVAESTPGTLAYREEQQQLVAAEDQVQSASLSLSSAQQQLATAQANVSESAYKLAIDQTNAWEAIQAAGTTGTQTIINDLQELKQEFPNAAGYINQLLGQIQADAVHEFGAGGLSLGQAFDAGIAQGMVTNAQAFFGPAAQQVINQIQSDTGNIAGIHSPSRLMADTIGRPLAQGLAVGMLGGLGDVRSAAEQMIAAAIPGLPGPGTGTGSYTTAGGVDASSIAPVARSATGGGGLSIGSVNITVQGDVQDGTSLGAKVVAVLQQYATDNGTVLGALGP